MKYLRGIAVALIGACEAVISWRLGKIAVKKISNWFDRKEGIHHAEEDR